MGGVKLADDGDGACLQLAEGASVDRGKQNS